MLSYLKRLVTAGAAYQVADVVAKVFALALLPVYTRALTREDYGTAELLLTAIIFVSILARLGVGEAYVRFHFLDEDPERRRRVARAAFALVLLTTTALGAILLALAGPLSEAILGFRDATLMAIAVLGLWAFTNLELAYAMLRVEERRRAYLVTSLLNVGLTIALTLLLVVAADGGVRGYLLGNYAASALVLVGLWWVLRDRLGLRIDRVALRPMLGFGLPTVPAEVSVFALNLVDRYYLYQVEGRASAGLYALAVKLAAVVVVTVRAFQYAWPPLAYSVTDDEEARRLYAAITTYYVLLTGLVVAGLALLGRWFVRLFAAPEFFPAHEALPWVALGWALYGLVLVAVVIAGRAQVTTRNFPAALAGLAVNVVLLLVLVPPLGIAGAGIALCGAYVVMLAVLRGLTRTLFAVPFEWGRLARAVLVIAAPTAAGELLLPEEGAGGFAARLAVLGAIPLLLLASGVVRPEEREAGLAFWRRLDIAGRSPRQETPPSNNRR